MRNLLCVLVLLAGSYRDARAQDSIAVDIYPDFRKTYYAHYAYMLDNRLTTSRGSRSMGRRWKLAASAFENSPEGHGEYLEARRLSERSALYSWLGTGLALSNIPVVAYATGVTRTRTGLAASLLATGFYVMSGLSGSRADNTMNRALWLRNRDALLTHSPSELRPRLRYLYDTETLWLTNSGYVKNGRPVRMSLLTRRGAAEFESIPYAYDLYNKYKRNKRRGVLMYATGLGAIVLSTTYGSLFGQNPLGPALLLGGSAVSLVGAGQMRGSGEYLRQAVYFRNYEVLERQLRYR